MLLPQLLPAPQHGLVQLGGPCLIHFSASFTGLGAVLFCCAAALFPRSNDALEGFGAVQQDPSRCIALHSLSTAECMSLARSVLLNTFIPMPTASAIATYPLRCFLMAAPAWAPRWRR